MACFLAATISACLNRNEHVVAGEYIGGFLIAGIVFFVISAIFEDEG
jgi:hypothetical protein